MKEAKRSRKRKRGKVHKKSTTQAGDDPSKVSGVNQSMVSNVAISKTKKPLSFLDKVLIIFLLIYVRICTNRF